jgi:hypothetical protein
MRRLLYFAVVQGYGVDVLDIDESTPSDAARKSSEETNSWRPTVAAARLL